MSVQQHVLELRRHVTRREWPRLFICTIARRAFCTIHYMNIKENLELIVNQITDNLQKTNLLRKTGRTDT